MIFQVIVEEDHGRQGIPILARIYQGLHQVGVGSGADGLSAVVDAFAEMQRRNETSLVTHEMKRL